VNSEQRTANSAADETNIICYKNTMMIKGVEYGIENRYKNIDWVYCPLWMEEVIHCQWMMLSIWNGYPIFVQKY